MNTQVGIAMAVTTLDFDIVTDLKADAVPVVIPRGHIAYRVAIAVLQKNTATVVAIQIGIVFPISIQRQIFDQDIFRVFAG